MASLTPAIDMWIDNPMVTGYGFPKEEPAPMPTETAHCPRCHLQWMRMPETVAENIMRPWEAYTGVMWITAPDHPVGRTFCRDCAIWAATCKDLIEYVEEHGLQREALEYVLIDGLDWARKISAEWVPALWSTLQLKLCEDDQLRDYINDMHAEPFADWMMERSS